MEENNCPCCPNHCSKDKLGCGRGKDYFNNSNNSSEPETISEKVIMDLRKCGHMLHHNQKLNPTDILSMFSSEELNVLHELLSKICNHFKM